MEPASSQPGPSQGEAPAAPPVPATPPRPSAKPKPRRTTAPSARTKPRARARSPPTRRPAARRGAARPAVALARVAPPPAPRPAPAVVQRPAAPPPAPLLDGRARHLLLISAPFLGFSLVSLGFAQHLLPALLAVEDGTAAAAGLFAVAGLAVLAAAQAVGGAWSDGAHGAHGPRWTPLLSASAFAAMALVLAMLASGGAGVLFAFLMLQAAAGVGIAAAQPLLAEGVPANRRGLGAGLRGGAEVLGLMATGALADGVLRSGRGGSALGLAVLLVLVGAIACAGALRALPPVPAAPAAAPGARGAVRRTLARPERAFARAALARAALVLGAVAATRGAGLAVEGRLAPGSGAGGAILGVLAVVLLVAALAGGVLSDRFGRRGVVRGGVFLGAAGCVLLALAQGPPELLVFGALATAGAGAALSAAWALLADLAPRGSAGRHLGLAGALGVAAAAAALLAAQPLPLPALLGLAAAASLAGWLALRRTGAARPPEATRFTVVRPPGPLGGPAG